MASSTTSNHLYLTSLLTSSFSSYFQSFSQSISLPHSQILQNDYSFKLTALTQVGAFSSLHTSQPLHTTPLLATAAIILQTGIDVIHIDGKKNICADMLSQGLISEYQIKFPHDCVCTFIPHHELLLAQWRECF